MATSLLHAACTVSLLLLTASLSLAFLQRLTTTTIDVRSNGSDKLTCLEGKTSCHSLSHALTALKAGSSGFNIAVHYSHQFNASSRLESVSRVAITGDSGVTISCERPGAGISFQHSSDVTIHGITWKNCGIRHNTTARLEPIPYHGWPAGFIIQAYSAIFMYNCTNVLISSSTFTSNRGSGVSLYDIRGDVEVIHSDFMHHSVSEDDLRCSDNLSPQDIKNCSPQSTGLYIEITFCGDFSLCGFATYLNFSNTHYSISHCRFIGNVNNGVHNMPEPASDYMLPFRDHWPFSRGGGLGLNVQRSVMTNITFSIADTKFINNTAHHGGGMWVHFRPWWPDHNQINVERCLFSGNNAEYNGGGLNLHSYLGYSIPVFKESFSNNWKVVDTNFTNNTAYWGGGVSFLASFSTIAYLSVSMEKCVWTKNAFHGGAAAVGLLRRQDPGQKGYFSPTVVFFDCTFQENEAILYPYNDSVKHVSGIVYTSGIPVHFHGNTTFMKNAASALCVSDTGANFSGKVTFEENVGFNGGAIFMEGIAWLGITEGVELVFANNTAFESGGALYYDFPSTIAMDTANWCFIRYFSSGSQHVPPSEWHASVHFHGNTALDAGTAVYISNLEECDWPNDNFTLFPIYKHTPFIFNFTGQRSRGQVRSMATVPHDITLTIDNSTLNSSGGFKFIMVMPGQNLNLTITAHDKMGHRVNTFLSVKCNFVRDYEEQLFVDDICLPSSPFPYGIVSKTRMIPSGSALNDFSLSAPRYHHDDFLLIFTTVESAAVMLPLKVIFTDCKTGFVYKDSSNTCECHDPDEGGNLFLCVQQGPNTIPCLLKDYWYGTIPVGNKSIPVYHRCLPGFCSNANLKLCEFRSHYRLDKSSVCQNNLTGPLCSSCPPNSSLSLSYNAYGCFECSLVHKVLLVLLILLECVFVVTVVVVYLKFNVKLSTAAVYGLIYFYSVLPFFLTGNLPDIIEGIILFVVDITTLDFYVLKYSQFCLFDGVSAIHYKVLHFIYPVVVILLIVTLIKLDQYCFRRFSLFSGVAATQALCNFLLISYTSVSITSLTIVLPIDYSRADSPGEVLKNYVLADPGVKYFDLALHLPFWILAMVVLIGLVLPYAFLMLFAPWIMKLPCISLARIKPILDEYQNCFQDRCRWFAGVYLLARPTLFLISSLGQDVTAYLQQLFCVSLVVLVATIQPYQKRVYNYIDIALLSGLAIISLTANNPSVREEFGYQFTLQTVIVTLLSLAPVVLLTVAFIITAVCQCAAKHSHNVQLYSVLPGIRGSPLQLDHSETPSSMSEDELLLSNDLPARFYDEEVAHRHGPHHWASGRDSEGRGGFQGFWKRLTSTAPTQRPHPPVSPSRPAVNAYTT